MRKSFLSTTVVLLFLACFQANAEDYPYIFQVNRDKGRIVTTHTGFMGLVHSKYVGYEVVSNIIQDNVVHLHCSGPGVTKCSVETPDGKTHVFNVGKSSFLFGDFESLFNEMLTYVEDEIAINHYRGQYTKKVHAISVEGTNVNISFNLVWNLDNEGSGSICMYAGEY